MGKSLKSVNSAAERTTTLKLEIILVALLILFHCINNIIIITQDSIPLMGDPGCIYRSAVELHDFWQTSASLLAKVHSAMTGQACGVFPPLLMTASAITMDVFGTTQDAVAYANIPFLILLLLSTYLMSRKMFDWQIAMASTALLSFFPATYGMSRLSIVIFSCSSLVAVSAASLYASDRLTNLPWTIVFAIALSLAALSYPSFSLFLIGPFIFEAMVPFMKSLKEKSPNVPQMASRLTLIILIMIVVAAPYYVMRTSSYFSQQGYVWGRFPSRSVFWALHRMMYPIPVILLIVSFISVVKSPRARNFLLSWMLVPTLFFSLAPVDGGKYVMRYIAPILPAAAILMGALLMKIVRKSKLLIAGSKRQRFWIVFSLILFIEIFFFVRLNYLTASSAFEPWGQSDSHFIDRESHMSLGLLSAREIPLEIDQYVDVFVAELGAQETPPSVFYLNRNMPITSMIRALAMSKVEYQPQHCEGIDTQSCIVLLEESDYLILEEPGAVDLGRPGGNWVWGETWNPEPVLEHLNSTLGEYEVLITLEIQDYFRQYYELEEAEFLRERVLILKNTNTQ